MSTPERAGFPPLQQRPKHWPAGPLNASSPAAAYRLLKTFFLLARLRRRDFEFVLLDDGLAGTDSVEFVRRLRHSEDCRNRLTPVVMMASMPDAARIAAARDAGVTEFLRKPFATIEAAGYVGPDRRRRAAANLGAAERRER